MPVNQKRKPGHLPISIIPKTKWKCRNSAGKHIKKDRYAKLKLQRTILCYLVNSKYSPGTYKKSVSKMKQGCASFHSAPLRSKSSTTLRKEENHIGNGPNERKKLRQV